MDDLMKMIATVNIFLLKYPHLISQTRSGTANTMVPFVLNGNLRD